MFCYWDQALGVSGPDHKHSSEVEVEMSFQVEVSVTFLHPNRRFHVNDLAIRHYKGRVLSLCLDFRDRVDGLIFLQHLARRELIE